MSHLRSPLPLICRSVASAGLLAAVMTSAHAAPIVSVTIDSQSANNTSILPSSTNVQTSNYVNDTNSPNHVVDTPRSVVITPAGPGVTGLAWDYIDTTTSYSTTRTTYSRDTGAAYVMADNSQPISFNGGKYIELKGTISVTTATTINLDLFAYGNYMPQVTPFGSAAPALPSFYFSTGGAALAALGTSNYSETSSYDSSAYSGSFTLAANSSLSFDALVYAGNDVSLGAFGLNLYTNYYGVSSTTTQHSNTSTQLVGAHLIPALAVPEPATYLMLLGGLLLVGGASRRRASQLFK